MVWQDECGECENRQQCWELKLPPGTQVLYAAPGGDKRELGFVTSVGPNGAYCRYWLEGREGEELRTKANSEMTPVACLTVVPSVDQDRVDRMIEELYSFEPGSFHYGDVGE